MYDQDRIERMASRVAFFFLAGGRDEESDLFSSAFSFLREKAKDFKNDLEEKARDSLKDSLIKAIKLEGVDVISVDISLGKYRGSRFVTSAKVRVMAKTIGQAKALVKVLKRYHPGYSLKEFDEDGSALYNIR